jgi:hypothetical protein
MVMNPPPLYLRLIKSVLKIPLSELCLPVVHCHKVLTMLLVFPQLDTINVNLPHCLVDDGRVGVRPRVRVRVRLRVRIRLRVRLRVRIGVRVRVRLRVRVRIEVGVRIKVRVWGRVWVRVRIRFHVSAGLTG